MSKAVRWSKTPKLSKKEFKAAVETGCFGRLFFIEVYQPEKKRAKNERTSRP